MKARLSMPVIFVVAWFLLYAAAHAQDTSRGGWGRWGYNAPQNRQWNYSPESGRPWGPYGGYGMDPEGRWARGEYRIEPDKGQRSYGPGAREPGYGPYDPSYENPPYQRERQKPLDEPRARKMMESYLDYTGNPNLKLGNVQERDGVFEGEIVTKKEGSLVDKVIIDKNTGQMRSIY